MASDKASLLPRIDPHKRYTDQKCWLIDAAFRSAIDAELKRRERTLTLPKTKTES